MLVLAIVAFGVPLAVTWSARVRDEVRSQARTQADFVAKLASDLLAPGSRAQLDQIATSAALSLHGRVIVVDARGRVVVDTLGAARPGTAFTGAGRPELDAALEDGRAVQVQRYSNTLHQELLATAVPIFHNGSLRPAGAVRVTQSVAAVHQAVVHVELVLALIAAIVLALGLIAGVVLAAQIGRPLRRLEAVARRVAQGDLSAHAKVEGSREQRTLANAFNEMTARTARLLDAERDFVADASHKLRTPLTGLRLRLEEARSLTADPEAAEDLEAAIHEVDRLSHTVDELLERSSDRQRPLTATRIELGDLAAACCERWQHAAHAAGNALVLRRLGGRSEVWAAREDLERALDALVENALSYSPSATTVEIVALSGRIEVRDRGPGVPESERARVFERFARGTAGDQGPPGSGLGLPIAREFAREWGGDVMLEPREGGGTIAVLSLGGDAAPAAEQQDADFARA